MHEISSWLSTPIALVQKCYEIDLLLLRNGVNKYHVCLNGL